MNKHLVPVTPFGEPSRAETRGQGLDADQPPRTPVPKRNASHRAYERGSGPPPKRVGPTRPPFPNPMETVLTASQLLSPSPSALSATSLPPGLLHLGLRHHHPLSPTQQRHKRNSWAGPSSPGHGSLGPGWVQSSPPSPSVQERSPSLLPFAVSLSRPSSASCLESSLQNSLHFRRWPPLENTDPRAPRGVVRPRSQGPSCCPFCAHRAPCWTLSTLQGMLLGAPRRCREPCATGIGALQPS